HDSVISLIYSHINSHPNSTSFPYTTLFRSRCKFGTKQPGRDRPSKLAGLDIGRLQLLMLQSPHTHTRRMCQDCFIFTVKQFRLLDRKSTRLNSSHVSISYAVFCLKKKKRFV